LWLHWLIAHSALNQIIHCFTTKLRSLWSHHWLGVSDFKYRIILSLSPKLFNKFLLTAPNYFPTYLSTPMNEFTWLPNIIFLKHIFALLDKIFNELFITTAHGKMKRSGLLVLGLELKVLSKGVILIDVEHCWTNGSKQFMIELNR
jgi:hypothetical protein